MALGEDAGRVVVDQGSLFGQLSCLLTPRKDQVNSQATFTMKQISRLNANAKKSYRGEIQVVKTLSSGLKFKIRSYSLQMYLQELSVKVGYRTCEFKKWKIISYLNSMNIEPLHMFFVIEQENRRGYWKVQHL